MLCWYRLHGAVAAGEMSDDLRVLVASMLSYRVIEVLHQVRIAAFTLEHQARDRKPPVATIRNHQCRDTFISNTVQRCDQRGGGDTWRSSHTDWLMCAPLSSSNATAASCPAAAASKRALTPLVSHTSAPEACTNQPPLQAQSTPLPRARYV